MNFHRKLSILANVLVRLEHVGFKCEVPKFYPMRKQGEKKGEVIRY